ncbi:pseudouridine synthase [Algoriphagus sp. CAU 1675]|uniref:pseudouridine synthase n=1 Tax=Algoriphagus sp. CAU 1675 TaxID=3032597 RepID=UPI0023DB3EA2|nr:pseudouridine synthase [Algoriphagus sp. CAU 1675]MDF2158913.1 pseudouridine synthase [Algoriphagus sp. CAU 1675]
MKNNNPKRRFFNQENESSEPQKPFRKDNPSSGKSGKFEKTEKKGFGKKRSFGDKPSFDQKKTEYSDRGGRKKTEFKPGSKPAPSFGKKRFFGEQSDSSSEGRFTRKEDSKSKKFEKKGKFEGKKLGTEFSKNRPESGNVYLGRGRDQKPVYGEKGSGNSLGKAPAKSGFGKNRPNRNISDVERPEYNFDALPAKKSKSKSDSDLIRLNKYIANSGICSRREADELIGQGLVTVNNEVITELGYKVKKSDRVVYQGKRINPEKPVYVLLNKPKDFITTTEDPMERKTVMSLVENACEERIFPVGRLDRNTTGLLLFTNDGELAAKLSHPSNEIRKIYQVTLDKPLTKKDEELILEGLTLEDGPANVDDMQVLSKDRTILGLEIHIGRNRIVRRIFAHLGYEVTALDRVMFAGLDKKDLKRGHYRFLTEKEVIKLKFFI